MKLKVYSGYVSVYNSSPNSAEFMYNSINKVHNIHSVLLVFDSVFISGHRQKIQSPSSGFYLGM